MNPSDPGATPVLYVTKVMVTSLVPMGTLPEVHYTIDGTEPNAFSTFTTGPFDLGPGIYNMKFIAIDDVKRSGIVSIDAFQVK